MKIRCTNCDTVLEAVQIYRGQCCHCSNNTYIRLDKHGQPVISASDLTLVEIVEGYNPHPRREPKAKKQKKTKYREPTYTQDPEQPKRVPRKLYYEVR